MKIFIYNLIFLVSSAAFAGGDSGGTIVSQDKIQAAIDFNIKLPQELFIRGTESGGTVFSERIISNRLALLGIDSTTNIGPSTVFKVNFLGVTDTSTIVSVNEDAFVVELPNSAVLRSEVLKRAIEASAATNQWFSLDN